MISLDLEVIFSLALLEKSECHFVFTFHFSIVQNPLSQDTGLRHVLLSSLFNVSSTSSHEAIQVVEVPHILRSIINAIAIEMRMKK